MNYGYSVEFTCGKRIIKDTSSATKIAFICMTPHRLFPLEADNVDSANVTQSEEALSDLWHRRFGHLNLKSLKCVREATGEWDSIYYFNKPM